MDGRIILAFVKSLLKIDVRQMDPMMVEQTDDGYADIYKINEARIKREPITQGYQFQQFVDIGMNKTAMIVENEFNKSLRFVLLAPNDESDEISLEALGMVQQAPDIDTYDVERIVKVCTVQGTVLNDDPTK